MASSKRKLARKKLIIASVLAVFSILVLHGVFFRKGKLAQVPVFGICSDATAGASEGMGQTGSVVQIQEVVPIKTCPDETGNAILGPGAGEDLEVTGNCVVDGSAPNGKYLYRNVNIYKKPDAAVGGTLFFADAVINFHANSILVEGAGSLIAGLDRDGKLKPIGQRGGLLTIYLYGKDQGVGGVGITCKTPLGAGIGPCGVPDNLWNGGATTKPMPLGNGVTDYFYPYTPLPFDYGTDAITKQQGYFGYKVLAVSFGGTLQLFGKKGAVYPQEKDLGPKDPGRSWGRLAGTILPGAESLTVETSVPIDWQPGDHIVVTTTDYLAGHSEELIIKSVSGNTITFNTSCSVGQDPITPIGQCKTPGIRWTHYGNQFSLNRLPPRLGITKNAAETRAAVALLTRSIRIVSEGDTPDQNPTFPSPPPYPSANAGYYFGGHTVARQGFKIFQMQGVEFHQLGQGGRLGHYPVHFHMARKVPAQTFVRDSSVSESMTRFYTIHATEGVTLARDVGYLSIGHGYYIEDATETNNSLDANIGIFARAAVYNAQNPRQVPGILASPDSFTGMTADQTVIYNSDKDTPAVFWITNGWNDFVGNMAAGAGLCGVCFWEPPANIGGPSRRQTWESYASEQKAGDLTRAGISPLKTFDGNYCTSAMTSFQSVGFIQTCPGVGSTVQPVPNPMAPGGAFYCEIASGPDRGKCGELDENPPYECKVNPNWQLCKDAYYPKIDPGNANQATKCPATGSCADQTLCTDKDETNCMVSVLNDYTTSFNYSPYNFAAVWLRRRWYLFSNSFISDVQNAGLSFISGGDYTTASSLPGLWELALKSVFVGETQPQGKDYAYASVLSPFNADALGLECDNKTDTTNYCMSKDNGFVLGQFSAFSNSERLSNIYDGPANQDSNAYLDIKRTDLGTDSNSSIYGRLKILGIPKDSKTGHCYIPNAAIAWKQPNGFYYPPTFHSRNLFFDKVDIRHYVIEPQFYPGTYSTNVTEANARYCAQVPDQFKTLFTGFTDIDRQTFLTDDDGSLTGYANTSSVNEDAFFAAPIEGPECKSDDSVKEGATARTSPYRYVTSVVYPDCAKQGGSGCGGNWSRDCATPDCYGVPLYREYLTGTESAMKNSPAILKWPPSIRMAGLDLYQREALTLNHGSYYIDTTVKGDTQKSGFNNLNVFEPKGTYDVFLIYARPDPVTGAGIEQTYSFYFGPGLDKKTAEASIKLIRVEVPTTSLIIKTVSASTGTLKAVYTDPIMTVTLNLSAFAGDFATATQNECVPQTFCKWNTATKKCVGLSPVEVAQPLSQAELDLTCGYAGRDISCPTNGCIGFQFTLPEQFLANDTTPPQAPCFPFDLTWDMTLKVADKDLAGECFQAPITKNFCGMSQSPAEEMSANPGERAPLSSDCTPAGEPTNSDDERHAQPTINAMAETNGTVSEARFLDDPDSR